MKQIRAPSGPGRISRFINITEFPSTSTLLYHHSHFISQLQLKKWRFFYCFTENAQLLPQTYAYTNAFVWYVTKYGKNVENHPVVVRLFGCCFLVQAMLLEGFPFHQFNKTEAAVFSCRLCFLRDFSFISLWYIFI